MEKICPVQQSIIRLSRLIEGPGPDQARVPELLRLLRLYLDVSEGRARSGHLEEIQRILEALTTGAHPGLRRVGEELFGELRSHEKVFLAHLRAHYCPTQECSTLSAPPCQLACPANVDIPSYVALVGMKRYEEALEVLWEDLPFPGILGRVCIHPCERACRRGEIDEPISICKLKRVAFDHGISERVKPRRISSHSYENKVAIIGSGPAGLSAAYFLARYGYKPTIFEAMPEPGGMLRWGIPAYRLPREVVTREIGLIKELGVSILTNVRFGEDVTYENLKEQGFEAFFIGIGAWCCTTLPIEGAEDNPNVLECLTFLRHENLRQSMVGERVVVIGGGNAAIDCVRTALRLDVREVNLVYRRSRQEMPAHKEEVEAAEHEGAIMTFLSSPVKVISENGKMKGLLCIRNRLTEPDLTGRRRPVPIKGSEYIIPADTIITAIGQEVDLSVFGHMRELELSPRRLVTVDPLTLETSIPGVFAGGDVITGPATVVEAVASGKKAAESIHRYLQGIPFSDEALLPFRRKAVPAIVISAKEKSRTNRPEMPCIPVQDRIRNFSEVELGYPIEAAEAEAKRCLRCDICVACGTCVDVCNQMGVEAIQLSFVEKRPSEKTDFLYPANQCIGCGACANNCPTGAISLEVKDGVMVLRMCGAEMSRHEMLLCPECNRYYISQKHFKYLQDKFTQNPRLKYARKLCPECSRSSYPSRYLEIIPHG